MLNALPCVPTAVREQSKTGEKGSRCESHCDPLRVGYSALVSPGRFSHIAAMLRDRKIGCEFLQLLGCGSYWKAIPGRNDAWAKFSEPATADRNPTLRPAVSGWRYERERIARVQKRNRALLGKSPRFCSGAEVVFDRHPHKQVDVCEAVIERPFRTYISGRTASAASPWRK